MHTNVKFKKFLKFNFDQKEKTNGNISGTVLVVETNNTVKYIILCKTYFIFQIKVQSPDGIRYLRSLFLLTTSCNFIFN